MVESLNLDGLYIFVTRGFSNEQSDFFESILKKIGITYKHIKLNSPTKGATETCLIGCDYIDQNDELIITNCDQYTPWNVEKFKTYIKNNIYDAIVSTYDHEDIEVGKPSKYSFIKLNSDNIGIELTEKFAISTNALNGIHYWKKAKLFVNSGTKLMNDTLSTEYFISLTFNKLIQDGYKVGIYKMEKTEFYALGTPDEVIKNINYL